MNQKIAAGCVELLSSVTSGRVSPVLLQWRRLVLQTQTCALVHGADCFAGLAEELAPRLWLEKETYCNEGVLLSSDEEFSFTPSSTMLVATTALHTPYGWLQCIPDAEYALWRRARLCHAAPLVVLLDAVVWRVIASHNATSPGSDNDVALATMATPLPSDIQPAFRLYLEAHRDGDSNLLDEVREATARGESDLQAHREYLFKIFHIIGGAPTLSHDLSKTKLVNFALGRCFSSDGLKLLQRSVSAEDCMALVRRLHLEVENHHPEHGPREELSLLDMYLDRVSRGVQKTHGWSDKAWHIPERFAPPDYKEQFATLEKQYGHLPLVDPGELEFPTLLKSARLDIRWEDVPQK